MPLNSLECSYGQDLRGTELQELLEIVGGAGAVAAVDGHDPRRRQRDARVQRGDLLVVPRGDLRVEDLREDRRRERQLLDTGEVVGQRDRPGDERDIARRRCRCSALAFGRLVVPERRIGTGEVDVARKEFLDPVARSAAGVVEDRAAGLGEHLTEVRHRLLLCRRSSPVIVADPIHYILRPPAGRPFGHCRRGTDTVSLDRHHRSFVVLAPLPGSSTATVWSRGWPVPSAR